MLFIFHVFVLFCILNLKISQNIFFLYHGNLTYPNPHRSIVQNCLNDCWHFALAKTFRPCHRRRWDPVFLCRVSRDLSCPTESFGSCNELGQDGRRGPGWILHSGGGAGSCEGPAKGIFSSAKQAGEESHECSFGRTGHRYSWDFACGVRAALYPSGQPRSWKHDEFIQHAAKGAALQAKIAVPPRASLPAASKFLQAEALHQKLRFVEVFRCKTRA